MLALGAWDDSLRTETEKPYFTKLIGRVAAAYDTGTVYPPKEDVFAAFRLTPPEQLRVVILGQDPYHEPGQAQGLAFSVRPGVKLPPSLRNIFAELAADCGIAPRESGDLTGWAEQGVFLLNTVLTVEAGNANSHADFGWQTFTDAVVDSIRDLPQPVAFILWGAQAQKKAASAASSTFPRLILRAPHPSPLSAYRGFFGSKPFSQVNAFLRANGEKEIEWGR